MRLDPPVPPRRLAPQQHVGGARDVARPLLDLLPRPRRHAAMVSEVQDDLDVVGLLLERLLEILERDAPGDHPLEPAAVGAARAPRPPARSGAGWR